MNRMCPVCHVQVAEDLTNCPICGKYVGAAVCDCPTRYADAGATVKKRKITGLDMITWITVLCAVIACAANIYLNVALKLPFNNKNLWFIYVVLAAFTIFVSVLLPVKRQRYKWNEANWLIFSVTILLVAIDLLQDMKVDWSIGYVLPNIVLATCIVSTFLIIFRKGLKSANGFTMILFLSILSLIFLILNVLLNSFKIISINIFPCFIAFLIILSIFISLMIFAFRPYLRNLFKKFHV